MLNSLVERVNATQLSEKDPDAAALLQKGFSTNPDAMYVLAQSVLVQNIALEQAHTQLMQAKEQIDQLQQQVQKPAHATSFLGSLLGHRDPAPPPQQAYTPQAEPEYQTPYNPPPQGGPQYGGPQYGQPQYGQPQYGAPQYVGAPVGQPSFLRSAAQTAAGVAAGALAFEGVESLLHGGFGHPGMGMGMGGWGMPGVGFGMGPGMGMGGGYERPIEENVVNNYYDTPGGGERVEHEHGGFGGFDSGNFQGGEQHLHESAGQQAQLQDASWNDSSNSGFDTSSDAGSDFVSDTGGDSGFADFGSGGDAGSFGDDSGSF
jgi:hypothetical protein